MRAVELLNSDLPTIGGELRRLFDWWTAELSEMLPAALRHRSSSAGAYLFDGAALTPVGRPGPRPLVLLDRALCFSRTILVPPMSNRDLADMLALNGDRYMPFPPDQMVVASAMVPPAEGREGAAAVVRALTRDGARRLCDGLAAQGIVPGAVRIAGEDCGVAARLDLLPALQRQGLLAPAGTRAAGWWGVVATFAALNVAAAIWQDRQRTDRLAGLVEQQRPAVAVAQRMAAQLRRIDALTRHTAARHGSADALSMLGAITAAVPDGAWVQRLDWSAGEVRLTGYRSADSDVAAALRRIPGVRTVRSTQGEAMAEIAAGVPFDMLVTFGGN